MLSRGRLHIVLVGFLLVGVLLSGRLFFLQIVEGKSFADKASHQYVTSAPHIFNRGSIFFSTKDGARVSAATLDAGYIISINPKLIDAEDVYEKVGKIISLETSDFFSKASKHDDPYEEIAHRVPEESAQKIAELELTGVSVNKERWRFYPGRKTASHALGFVGYVGDELAGRYGLERYYDDVLERKDEGLYVNFFAEIFSNIAESILKEDNSREGDLILSLEPAVQSALEKTISDVKAEWNSEEVGGIIMDPKTGALYGIAAVPSFDPNVFSVEKNQGVFKNPLIENVYEMGSIIKPLTVAAGLDAGVITANSTYDDKGFVTLDQATIRNFDGKARGVVPMQEVLSQSLNTGVVHIMQKLGKERFTEYFLSYGLGDETGVDLPNEASGIISNLESPRAIEYATASFGQGIAMSPIATVRALSALANGGTLPSPHIVSSIDFDFGGEKKMFFTPSRQVIRPESAEEITRMLVAVVDKALLGGTVKLPHHSIAAKTGTAQIADSQNGGYYEGEYLHSFFGYFPAYDPKFIVFLYNIRPQGATYSSQTLTHPFIGLAKFLINYYDIPPDR